MGGVSSGGDGTNFPDASFGGDGGTGSNGGSGGSGGSAGDDGTGGTEAGQGGAAGTGGGNGGSGGNPDPGELMTDPSFESGLSSWAPFGGGAALLTRVQDAAHDGDSSLLCSNRIESYYGAGFSLMGLVDHDETYTISAWVRLAEGDSDAGPPAVTTVNVIMKTKCQGELDTATEPYTQIVTGAPLTSAWTRLSGTVTPINRCEPLALALIDHRIYIAEAPVDVSFYIDDVSFRVAE